MILLSRGPSWPLTANVVYAVPSAGNQITWQSAAGADLQGSVDGITFASLGVSAANEAKTVASSVGFIKTAASGVTIISKRITDSYFSRIIASRPSNYWRLNEAGGLTAFDLAGGANGTISGGVTLGQSGALADGDKAMAFNGTGRILTAASVPIPLVCTIEGWIKFVPAAHQPMFATFQVAGTSGNTVFVGLYQDGRPYATGVADAFGAVIASSGAWHHLAYVLNGSTVGFYLDGVFDRTQPYVRTIPSAGPGQLAEGPGIGSLNGSLDEVAIYPVALTAAQILSHYQAGLRG